MVFSFVQKVKNLQHPECTALEQTKKRFVWWVTAHSFRNRKPYGSRLVTNDLALNSSLKSVFGKVFSLKNRQ